MNDQIKVGFCVAYDWPLLEISIPLVYNFADTICLTLDRDRMGWTCRKYPFNEPAFFELIKKLDTDKKIKIIEEDFHFNSRNPMENEVRQRNRMAGIMGKGGWHVQLDCDEYFLNFGSFTAGLKSLKLIKQNMTNICCPFITMYKKDDKGYFIIANPRSEKLDFVPVATTNPNYEYGRRNGYFNYHTEHLILHQSWAHATDEVQNKLSNWGHSDDFDSEEYFNLWRSMDETNIKQYHNFHPMSPGNWPGIKFIPAQDIRNLIRHYQLNPVIVNKYWLWMHNSRILSKFRSLIHR